MDENRVAGSVRAGAGRVESAVGGALGDTKTQAQGNLDTAQGRIQNAAGQAADTVRDVADHAGEYASQAYDQASDLAERAYDSSGRYYREGADLVRRNPATASLGALAVAGLIGYLISQLFRSGSGGSYQSARYGRGPRYARGADHDDDRGPSRGGRGRPRY